MTRSSRKKTVIIIVTAFLLIVIAGILLYFLLQPSDQSNNEALQPIKSDSKPVEQTAPQPTEAYTGLVTNVDDSFSVKVPNGWSASISKNPNFIAIMFARPNLLDSLKYDPATPPTIDENGIPSWGGLTEHFYIRLTTGSQRFNPTSHLEVSSQPFAFDDGFIGTGYTVIKHATEAQQYGGLQKDTEWQGRTYLYEKADKQIEAHLALYPSTTISIPFYEDVVRSLKFTE